MSRRVTVKLDVANTADIIKSKCRSYSVFCEKMGRSVGWVSEWKKSPPKKPNADNSEALELIRQSEEKYKNL